MIIDSKNEITYIIEEQVRVEVEQIEENNIYKIVILDGNTSNTKLLINLYSLDMFEFRTAEGKRLDSDLEYFGKDNHYWVKLPDYQIKEFFAYKDTFENFKKFNV